MAQAKTQGIRDFSNRFSVRNNLDYILFGMILDALMMLNDLINDWHEDEKAKTKTELKSLVSNPDQLAERVLNLVSERKHNIRANFEFSLPLPKKRIH